MGWGLGFYGLGFRVWGFMGWGLGFRALWVEAEVLGFTYGLYCSSFVAPP